MILLKHYEPTLKVHVVYICYVFVCVTYEHSQSTLCETYAYNFNTWQYQCITLESNCMHICDLDNLCKGFVWYAGTIHIGTTCSLHEEELIIKEQKKKKKKKKKRFSLETATPTMVGHCISPQSQTDILTTPALTLPKPCSKIFCLVPLPIWLSRPFYPYRD